MKTLIPFILSLVIVSFSYSQAEKKLSNEDYLILNVFLEQQKFVHLDLSIINTNKSDSTFFLNSYNRDLQLYNSFKDGCIEQLREKDTLDYDTNFLCSLAKTFESHKNLFSQEELVFYSSALQKGKNITYTIDFDKILIPTIFPLTKEIGNDKNRIKIHGLYYNDSRDKVLIKYAFNQKHLFHVIKKEDGWWRSIGNFAM